MRIVCVDDDPVFLNLMRGTLLKLGYTEIEAFLSGEQALEALRGGSHPVDCFLVDIQMPGIDGVELCRSVRAIDSYRNTPIVMVTKMSEKAYVDMAFSAGATDYVTKPLDEMEFRSRIGMIQRLHNERKVKAALLAQHGQMRSDNLPVELDSPFLLPELDNAVDYFALENYLLTLGKSRLMGCAAMAIRFKEVEVFHSVLDSTSYHDVLSEIGHGIFDSLNEHPFLISYAGRGLFVAFFPEKAHINEKHTEEDINHILHRFRTDQFDVNLPAPSVVVGAVTTNGIFAMGRANKMLTRAIACVQISTDPGLVSGRLRSA